MSFFLVHRSDSISNAVGDENIEYMEEKSVVGTHGDNGLVNVILPIFSRCFALIIGPACKYR